MIMTIQVAFGPGRLIVGQSRVDTLIIWAGLRLGQSQILGLLHVMEILEIFEMLLKYKSKRNGKLLF